jgi:sporulation protein YlmC with PRC-barrel domain
MRLSDLIGSDVFDFEGRSYGRVHDALLVQDGPVLPSGIAAFRLHGLAAGRHAVGTQLGYTNSVSDRDTPMMRGPAPIRWFVRRLQRDAVYIPWGTVTIVERDRVVVSRAPARIHDTIGGGAAATVSPRQIG